MSLIWMDGFEDESLWDKKYTIAEPVYVEPTTGRNGNGILFEASGTSLGGSIRRHLGAGAHATLITGFWMEMQSANGFPDSSTYPLLRLSGDGGATSHLNFYFSSDAGLNLRVYNGAGGGSLLDTSGMSFTHQVGYYVEIKATLHDSTGSVEIKVDGTTRGTVANVDTRNGGTVATFDAIRLGGGNNSGINMKADDWYVLNGAGGQYDDFLGDVTVETIRPDGNGNSSQWVGSDTNSTDNYLLIDETIYSDADYVESPTTNNKDLYTYGALAAASGPVKGVMALGTMQKTASGAQSARQITRVGGTNYNGGSVALTTGDLPYAEVWEENPGTATDWTISDVNGAEFGVEVL